MKPERNSISRYLKVLSISFFLFWLIVGQTVASADTRYKIKNGVIVYVGALPAAMIGGHPRDHEGGVMHGGPPTGPHYYHVVVALFDQTSGARIKGAHVKASVTRIDAKTHSGYKNLEPMLVNGRITYGGYFRMLPTTKYKIRLRIKRAKQSKEIELEFSYQAGQASLKRDRHAGRG